MNTQIRTNALVFITVALIILGAFAITMPASAFWSPRDAGDDNDIRVSISNRASVSNTVETEAETGDNQANGGDGEEGGNGGEAEGTGDNTGGNGGNGGSGALGGLIGTGVASAYSSVMNEVNVVRTLISDSCGCEEDRPTLFSPRGGSNSGDDNDIRVRISNDATVNNDVETEAETGDNQADGGNGEEGGNGGDAEGSDDRQNTRSFFSFWSFGHHNQNDNKSTGGHGGTGGNGGIGGEIYSGNATSGSEVVNVVNRMVTRITR